MAMLEKRFYPRQIHCIVAIKSLMLRCYFTSSILKTPRRIRVDGRILFAFAEKHQIINRFLERAHQYTQSPIEIAQAARILFDKNYNWSRPVRAISVTAINLVPSEQPIQMSMFQDDERRIKQQQLDDCIDRLRSRFGKGSIVAASLYGDLHMPGDKRELVRMPSPMYR